MADPLAPLTDLEAVLGRSLSGDAATQAEKFLDMASNLVRDVGDDTWTSTDAPDRVVDIALEAARRAVENPGAHSQTSIGDVSISYRGTGTQQDAVFLTKQEHRAVRRAAGTLDMAVTLVGPWSGDDNG